MHLDSQHPNLFFGHHYNFLFLFPPKKSNIDVLPFARSRYLQKGWPGIGLDVATGMTSKIFAPHGRRDLLNVEARKVHSEDRRWKRWARCVAIAMPLMIFCCLIKPPKMLSFLHTVLFLGIGFRDRDIQKFVVYPVIWKILGLHIAPRLVGK